MQIKLSLLAGAVLLSGCVPDPKNYETTPVKLSTPKGQVICQLYGSRNVVWDRAIAVPPGMGILEGDRFCKAFGERQKEEKSMFAGLRSSASEKEEKAAAKKLAAAAPVAKAEKKEGFMSRLFSTEGKEKAEAAPKPKPTPSKPQPTPSKPKPTPKAAKSIPAQVEEKESFMSRLFSTEKKPDDPS